MSTFKGPMTRHEARAPVLPVEVKGLLSRQGFQQLQAPFFVWDISDNGIGILISDELKAGEEVLLTFGHPVVLTVSCKVAWSVMQEPDYDFQEPSYRAGLETQPGQPDGFHRLAEAINALRD